MKRLVPCDPHLGSLASDHDMPKKPNADDTRRISHLGRRPVIGLARLRAPARMVVGDGEGTSVVAKYRVQDLSNRDKRAVDRALRDDYGLPEPVCGVAHEHEDALTAQASQLPTRDFSHIARSSQ